MFKLVDEITVEWPVKVQKPVDGGTTVEEAFTGVFRIVDEDTAAEILGREGNSNRNLMTEVLVGWRGLGDESGKPLPFDEAARQRVMRVPYVMAALVRAWFEASSGAPRKNSLAPGATGPAGS